MGSSLADSVTSGRSQVASIWPYLWMVLGSFLFAVMSELAHAAKGACDWQIIAIARTGLALTFAALLVVGARREFVVWRPPVLWMRSLAGSVSLVCGFFAVTHMPVSDSLTLSNMYPLWVAVLSWPMLRVAPRREVWWAVLCGTFGVFLLQKGTFSAGQFVWVIALVASFSSAVALIGLHKLQYIDPRAIVVHFSGVSLGFCLLALWLFPRSVPLSSLWDAKILALLLGVGACATGGQLLLTKSFAEGEPAKVSVVGLSQVGFSMLIDAFWWGRSFTLTTLAGIVLVVVPTAWVMLRRVPRTSG